MFGIFNKKSTEFSASQDMPFVQRYNINGFDLLYVTLNSEYNRSPIVNRVVSVIADSVANLPPLIINEDNRSKIKDHPFLSILKTPNEEQIWIEFVRDTISDYLLNFSSYTYLGLDTNGEINHLTRVKEENVNIKINTISGNPDYYTVKGYSSQRNIKYYPYFDKRAQLLKWSQYNSKSMFFGEKGVPKLSSAIDEIHHVELASKYNLSFLKKGARPSFALIIGAENGYAGQLTQEQRNALKVELQSKIGGAENAGETMILEGGMDIKQLSTNNKDMDFKELTELSIIMICMIYGVPPEMVGITKAKTYNSAEEARTAFFDNTIMPIANLFYGKMSASTMFRYALNKPNTSRFKKAILTYDKSSIDSLEKRKYEIFEIAKKSGALTINERRALQHLDPVDGGDVVLIGTGEMPHNMTTRNAVDKNGVSNEQSDGGEGESKTE